MITKAKTGFLAVALTALGTLSSPVAVAEGDADEGAALAYSCLGCHGIEGYRNAYPSYRVPKLGGQKASYLVIALKGYRDGTRKHTTMNAQAESLSDEQIDNVAAYFASLNNETVEAGGTSGTSLAEAATCTACHGQNGISLSPSWPSLAGQHEDYLVHSLKAYRDGDRTDAAMMPMAANLTDPEIELLAKYFSRLEGLETTKPE